MFAKPEGQEETRLALFGEELPEIPASERLASCWQALGYARDSMAGPAPFEWAEVEAYNRLTDADLSPCEASCLVDMSRAYCVEIANRDPLRKSPMERT